jgi:hypothetical protein
MDEKEYRYFEKNIYKTPVFRFFFIKHLFSGYVSGHIFSGHTYMYIL